MIEPFKFNKLPKYVQQEIWLLRRQRDEARATIAELRDLSEGEGETNVFVDNHDRANLLLPKNSRVSFDLGEDRLDVSHEASHFPGQIQIYGYSMRGHSMIIVPASSNVAYVDMMERY
jgi:hypothetical protein